MKNLVKYSIKHPISIISYSILIVLAGFLSLYFIEMDFLPKLKDRTLLVSTSFYGIPASQMQEIVTIPIEDSFSSLKGIKNITSVTRDNFSFLKLELQYGTNINTALIEARQIIDNTTLILPNECSKPEVEIFSPSKNELMTVCAIPKNKDFIFARNICETEIKHQLLTLKGVGKINISGGLEEEIKLIVDQKFLCAKNLTFEDLAQAITQTNYEYPAGTIKNYDNEYILKTSGLYKTQSEILETLIQTNTEPILLKDISTLQSSHREKKTFCYFDNFECISLEIQKKTNSNPIETSKLLKQKINELNKHYDNISFLIINDNSKEIRDSILNVFISAILGTIITIILIFLFFKNLKIALIMASPIPFCILFTISVLKFFNKTLNLFSMSGISIAIGMIVDATIVVTESIIDNCSKSEINFEQTLFYSVDAVNKSNLSSALTTIIVFIPFFFLPGIFGELFSDLSIAIIASIIFSFIISITFIPAIIKLSFRKSKINIKKNLFMINLQEKYKHFLVNTIDNNFIKHICIISSIIISIFFAFTIKKEFIQPTKTNQVKIIISYPRNYTLQNIQKQTEKLIASIQSNFPSLNFYIQNGIEENDYYKLSDFNQTDCTTSITFFTTSNTQKKQIIEFLNKQNINFTQEQSQDLISKAFDINNNYIITQNDKNKFLQLQNSSLDLKPLELIKESFFIPDTNKCNYYKIPRYYISHYIYQLLNGVDAGFFYNNDKRIPIKITSATINNFNLENLSIQKTDKLIPISALGNFSINTTNKILYRYNKENAFQTKINLTDINHNPLLKDCKIINLSKSQFNELKENSILLLIIVLILLYCILGAQFESFLLPLIFLISTIPAFTGALFSLTIFNQSLNINSILSLVILFGITVNNAIILFESLQEKKLKSNLPSNISKQNCITNFSEKLRPILITSTTSFVALIPFWFDPFGINSQSSISIALCGGLLFSVIVVLIIIPNILLNHSKGFQNELQK